MSDVVFVIGSKPEAVFPDVKPTRIYAANGAIARAQEIMEMYDTPLTGVLFRIFLSAREKQRKSPTAAALNGCRGDRFVITGGGPRHGQFDQPQARGLRFRSEERLSRPGSMLLKLRYASLVRVARDIRDEIRSEGWAASLRKIRKTRSLTALGISTGMLAVLMALSESDDQSCVYVIGVGIDAEEGQFYDAAGTGRFRHLKADKAMVRDVLRKVSRNRLIFTDVKFAEFAQQCCDGHALDAS